MSVTSGARRMYECKVDYRYVDCSRPRLQGQTKGKRLKNYRRLSLIRIYTSLSEDNNSSIYICDVYFL